MIDLVLILIVGCNLGAVILPLICRKLYEKTTAQFHNPYFNTIASIFNEYA